MNQEDFEKLIVISKIGEEVKYGERCRITVIDAEFKHSNIEDDPQRVREFPELLKPFGFINALWENLKSKMQDGDELWEYKSGGESWENLAGREGIALVRDGKIIDLMLTGMN
jgi:hypothetical protein